MAAGERGRMGMAIAWSLRPRRGGCVARRRRVVWPRRHFSGNWDRVPGVGKSLYVHVRRRMRRARPMGTWESRVCDVRLGPAFC